MPPSIRVAILWHMHQPCYRNPASGRFDLPWLRLHALKDYFGMVHLLEEFPGLRLTFNLVPSLLAGLEQYLAGGVDPFAEVFRKPAADLAPEEARFLVRHFFSIHYENHVKPLPRYDFLHRKKMERLARDPDPDWTRVFSTAELRDLQVCFQLAYTDESYRESDERISGLFRRGRDFSEADKTTLAAVEEEILRRVVPEYKKFQDSGQAELCTSPFYHPILPLLLDAQAGRKANERLAPYDLDFCWEEDAWEQLQTGLDLMERTFGRRPRGVWPPEGGVSEAALRLLARAGIAWTASDEEVLNRSLPQPLERDPRLALRDPAALYAPYTLAGLPTKLFFRDHLLSDLIGFYYQKYPARDAAAELFARIRAAAAAGPEGMVVPIILDGENAWEFYPRSGREFLREFYRLLCSGDGVETVTFSQAAAETGRALPRLKCGSWINGNFDIWIGDRDDQRAWELLKGARDAFQAGRDSLPAAARAEIGELLRAAQGSDWFWWYGRENYTPDLDVFDGLFRANLRRVYELLGLPLPEALLSPIPASAPTDRLQVAPPRGALTARIDGRVSGYFEWLEAGRVDVLAYGGAMNIANPLVKTLHFGFDGAHLFLRIDTKKHARTYFETGFALRLVLKAGGAWQGDLAVAEGELQGSGFADGSAFAAGAVIEARIPLAALQAGAGDEIEAKLLWSFNGQPFQSIPARGAMTLKVPTARDYARFWQV